MADKIEKLKSKLLQYLDSSKQVTVIPSEVVEAQKDVLSARLAVVVALHERLLKYQNFLQKLEDKVFDIDLDNLNDGQLLQLFRLMKLSEESVVMMLKNFPLDWSEYESLLLMTSQEDVLNVPGNKEALVADMLLKLLDKVEQSENE